MSETIRAYAEQKLAKLDRQLGDDTRAELELRIEKNPSIAANQVAEVTVWTQGITIRAHEATRDMRASIDQLMEKVLRQAKEQRDKRYHAWERDRASLRARDEEATETA